MIYNATAPSSKLPFSLRGQVIYAMDLDGDDIEEYVGMSDIENSDTMVYFSE